VDDQVAAAVADQVAALTPSLIELRRDLHAHPELSRQENRSSQLVAQWLRTAGLEPTLLAGGVGVLCDVGDPGAASCVALRGDLDALPVHDEKVGVPYRSSVPGVCHACGHDMHTAIVVGAGLVLADLARRGRLRGRVRLILQHAEEAMPGGALDVIATGALNDVHRIFCLHCDPRLDVGMVGLRTGPVTGSSDHVAVEVLSTGGHTARPHLTGDVVYALGKVVTEVPAILSRRIDPRAGLSVVWGSIHAGAAANVIPQQGRAEGTVRSLDAASWERAPEAVAEAVQAVAAAYDVTVNVEYTRGEPPVVNDATAVADLREAATTWPGHLAAVEVAQSLGAEDFAWYLEKVPGALARLGVHTPGQELVHDLHQGTFDADERAIAVGVQLLVGAALLAV